VSTLSRKLFTGATASVIVAASIAFTAPAASAGPSPETLTTLASGRIPVTSTTGKHLLLSINALRFASTPGASNAHSKSQLTVTLASTNGVESHQWVFPLAAGFFHDDGVNGVGTLATGSQIAPFGHLKLKITPTHSAVVQHCDSANKNVIHRERVRGSVSFHTHSTGANAWGSIATATFQFSHGKLTAGHGPDVEEACAKIPCQAGATWNANKGLLSLNGTDVARKGKKAVSRIAASRLVHIGTPANTQRLDIVKTTAPAPSLTPNGAQASLDITTSGGVATGSAKITSNTHSIYNAPCTGGQETGKSWSGPFHGGAGGPVTLNEDIFGPLSISLDKHATFQKFHIT
jgi:hypothetical protein